jgi:hypothetical protein
VWQRRSRPERVGSRCRRVVGGDMATGRLTTRTLNLPSLKIGSISKLTLMNSSVPCVPPYAKSCNITDPPIIRQSSLITLAKANFLTSSAHPKNRNSPRIPAKLRYMLLHPPQRSLLIQQPHIKHPLPLNLITRQESKRTQLLIISLCSPPSRHKVSYSLCIEHSPQQTHLHSR